MIYFRPTFAAIVLVAAVVAAGPAAQAEDRTFLGIEVTAIDGTYLVIKGANVRTGPKTGAKRLGTIKAGSKVTVVGRAKGGAGWMAIQRDGKDYGFVYAPVMLPMIDGALKKSVSGRALIENRVPCGYTFEFRGKNTVDGDSYAYSDYEITYRCNDKGKPFRILAPMFMTEVPFRLTHKPVYQISIDLMEVENGYDEVFSTTFHYLPEETRVVFAGVSIKDQGRPPKVTERRAASVAEALAAAVEIAPDAWAASVWRRLAKVHIEGGG